MNLILDIITLNFQLTRGCWVIFDDYCPLLWFKSVHFCDLKKRIFSIDACLLNHIWWLLSTFVIQMCSLLWFKKRLFSIDACLLNLKSVRSQLTRACWIIFDDYCPLLWSKKRLLLNHIWWLLSTSVIRICSVMWLKRAFIFNWRELWTLNFELWTLNFGLWTLNISIIDHYASLLWFWYVQSCDHKRHKKHLFCCLFLNCRTLNFGGVCLYGAN